jgi:hypothetical protein
MINFLRTASILDKLGLYKLADRFTKIAIDTSDLDFDQVYRNPETFSDFALTRARKEGKDPIEVLGDDNFTFDRSKDPVEQIADKHKGTRKHFELYPQILLFPENGVWKFFFMDPLSFKALSAGSDKEGKLITDQLSIPGLEELYSDEEDAEEIRHHVVFTTNLPLEDYSKDEAISRIRQKFPDAHIDFQMNGVDDREFYDEDKDIDLT